MRLCQSSKQVDLIRPTVCAYLDNYSATGDGNKSRSNGRAEDGISLPLSPDSRCHVALAYLSSGTGTLMHRRCKTIYTTFSKPHHRHQDLSDGTNDLCSRLAILCQLLFRVLLGSVPNSPRQLVCLCGIFVAR